LLQLCKRVRLQECERKSVDPGQRIGHGLPRDVSISLDVALCRAASTPVFIPAYHALKAPVESYRRGAEVIEVEEREIALSCCPTFTAVDGGAQAISSSAAGHTQG
jgi:hypothetical protein